MHHTPDFHAWDQAWRAYAAACRTPALAALLPGGVALDTDGHPHHLAPHGAILHRADTGWTAHTRLAAAQALAPCLEAARHLRTLLGAHTDPGLLLSQSVLGAPTLGRARLRVQPPWATPNTSPWQGAAVGGITPDTTPSLWATPTALARLCTTLGRQHRSGAPARTIRVETGWQGGRGATVHAAADGLLVVVRTLPGCSGRAFFHAGRFPKDVCNAFPLPTLPATLLDSWARFHAALSRIGPTAEALMWAKGLEKAAHLLSAQLRPQARARLDSLWNDHLAELARATHTRPGRWMFHWHHTPTGEKDLRWTYADPDTGQVRMDRIEDVAIVAQMAKGLVPTGRTRRTDTFLIDTAVAGMGTEMRAVALAETAEQAAAMAWRMGWTHQTTHGGMDVWTLAR